MNTKNSTLALIIFLIITTLSGCKAGKTAIITENSTTQPKTNNAAAYPLSIKDSYDRLVTIEKEPERVISVAPNITETVFALGKGSKLVGRTDFCDFPEEAKKISSVGSLRDPSIEKITSLKPDLVIASTHFKTETIKKLEELNIKVVVLYGEESFDGIYKVLREAGSVLNARGKADELIAGMKKKVTEVQEKVKGKDKPGVYYVVSYGKLGESTAGKDTFIGQAIEMAGGKNTADDVTGWKYSLEKLLEKNPDILICSKYFDSKVGILNTNGYKDLKAVKNGKLFEYDNNLLDRQGPRLADGLMELARIIHPELFK